MLPLIGILGWIAPCRVVPKVLLFMTCNKLWGIPLATSLRPGKNKNRQTYSWVGGRVTNLFAFLRPRVEWWGGARVNVFIIFGVTMPKPFTPDNQRYWYIKKLRWSLRIALRVPTSQCAYITLNNRFSAIIAVLLSPTVRKNAVLLNREWWPLLFFYTKWVNKLSFLS